MTEQTTDQAAETTAQTVPYGSAVKQGRTAWNAATRATWTLARLAATVETKYADNTLVKLADAIAPGDLSGATLANYRTTWLAYVGPEYVTVDGMDDAPDGDRRDAQNSNSFTVHEKFNSYGDRFALLAQRHWTAAEARALVTARKNGDPDPDFDGEGEGDGEGAGGSVEPVNELDKLKAQAAELEAKLLKVYLKIDAIVTAQDPAPDDTAPEDTAPVMHNPGGIPEHDADSPHAACPVCTELGIAPKADPQAGSPRRARRNRKQPAAA